MSNKKQFHVLYLVKIIHKIGWGSWSPHETLEEAMKVKNGDFIQVFHNNEWTQEIYDKKGKKATQADLDNFVKRFERGEII